MKNLSKIKILYIGPIPPEVGGKSAGGIATHCWQLATEAHKKGYEVYILANTTSSFNKDGISVIAPPQCNKLLKVFYAIRMWSIVDKRELRDFDILSFKEKTVLLYEAYFLKKILDIIKPNLIHVHSLQNFTILSLKIIRPSISLIVTNNEFYIEKDNEEKRDLSIANINLSITDFLICISKYTRSRMEKFGLNYQGRLRIINIPIDSSRLSLLEKEESKRKLNLGKRKIVLFIGGYKAVEKKGLDILLKAFYVHPYLSKKCKLIIKSYSEGVSYAKRFVEQKNIDVLVLLDRTWSEIVNYYNAADVFVMPSRSEGFGIVYAEALLAGTPVVGFHRTLSEMEDLFGIYIGEKFDGNKEDEKALAEKIIKVLNTDFDRKLLRRKVIEKLSWDAKFSEFDSLYREVSKG